MTPRADAVRRALDGHGMQLPEHVDLAVVGGWVRLDGVTGDRAAWDDLVRVVAGVEGVEGVDDRVAGRVVTRVRRGGLAA